MNNYTAHIARATNCLERALASLAEEIESYPTPVSGCDAQYNHLLADRTRIESALRALGASVFIPTPRVLNQGDPVESR